MIFKQYYLGCLAHASYMIADEQTRTAAVVDPQRDVDAYVNDAAAQGLRDLRAAGLGPAEVRLKLGLPVA